MNAGQTCIDAEGIEHHDRLAYAGLLTIAKIWRYPALAGFIGAFGWSRASACVIAQLGEPRSSATMTARLVTDVLLMAIWRRSRPKAVLHHSDRRA